MTKTLANWVVYYVGYYCTGAWNMNHNLVGWKKKRQDKKRKEMVEKWWREGNYQELKLGIFSLRNWGALRLKCAGVECNLTEVDHASRAKILSMSSISIYVQCSSNLEGSFFAYIYSQQTEIDRSNLEFLQVNYCFIKKKLVFFYLGFNCTFRLSSFTIV